MDNLSVHKAARIKAAIIACGCILRFLPAYSPDFNPIEQAFSKLKAFVCKCGSRLRETLLISLATALTHITTADASAWFHHAGYSLPALSP